MKPDVANRAAFRLAYKGWKAYVKRQQSGYQRSPKQRPPKQEVKTFVSTMPSDLDNLNDIRLCIERVRHAVAVVNNVSPKDVTIKFKVKV